jgi:hypothetical protein
MTAFGLPKNCRNAVSLLSTDGFHLFVDKLNGVRVWLAPYTGYELFVFAVSICVHHVVMVCRAIENQRI